MLNYTIKRILGIIPILFGVMLISFVLTRAMPGNPYKALLIKRKITDSTLAAYEADVARLGLDLPVLPQFYRYFVSCMGIFWSMVIFTYMGFLGIKMVVDIGIFVKAKVKTVIEKKSPKTTQNKKRITNKTQKATVMT